MVELIQAGGGNGVSPTRTNHVCYITVTIDVKNNIYISFVDSVTDVPYCWIAVVHDSSEVRVSPANAARKRLGPALATLTMNIVGGRKISIRFVDGIDSYLRDKVDLFECINYSTSS